MNKCGDGCGQAPHEGTCDRKDVARQLRNQRARQRRRAMSEALDSVGAKRVRGSQGGTFYE